MRIVSNNFYRGPSLYAELPVVRWCMDVGKLHAWPTGKLGPTYVDALLDVFPTFRRDEPADQFVSLMLEGEGVPLASVVQHVADRLQSLAGHPTRPGQTHDVGNAVFDVLIGYHDVNTANRALQLAKFITLSMPSRKSS